jgi:hypothetical protein
VRHWLNNRPDQCWMQHVLLLLLHMRLLGHRGQVQ